MKAIHYCVVTVACTLFVGPCAAADADWKPAYDEDQLDVINKDLEAWKPIKSYATVRDAFRGRDYKVPDDKADSAPWEWSPDSFASQQQAMQAGCQCDFIKDYKHKTCFLKIVGDQSVWLSIYDQDGSGKYAKNQVICPPTFYGEAAIDFVDIFGDGQKFLRIEHVGDHGTGTYETIHWILGWRDGAFHTVLWEVVHSYLGATGMQRDYRVQYTIQKGKLPRIALKHNYDAVNVGAEPYDNHSQWKDWLFWNDKTFSFYDVKAEDMKTELGNWTDSINCLRLNIERGRKRVLGLTPLPSRLTDAAAEEYERGIHDLFAPCDKLEYPVKNQH